MIALDKYNRVGEIRNRKKQWDRKKVKNGNIRKIVVSGENNPLKQLQYIIGKISV